MLGGWDYIMIDYPMIILIYYNLVGGFKHVLFSIYWE